MQVILWMLGFVVLIAFLVLLKSKMHLSFSIRVLIALLLGAAFGLALFFLAEKTVNQEVRRWVSLVGFGYVDLLRMLIIPLVPTSIIAGLIKLSNTSELKQMGVRTIGIFLFTATVAGIIGLLVGNIFSVGTGMAIGDLAAREASTVTNLFAQFRNFIPSNFVKSAAETNMIPLVVFSIFIGVSAIMVKTKKPEAVKPFQDILESFLQIVMQLTKIVLKLTPYGVLGLTTYWLSSTGMSALLSLGIFVVAMVVACLVQLGVVYGGLLTSVAKVNPIRFYRAASPALLLAFSSRSALDR